MQVCTVHETESVIILDKSHHGRIEQYRDAGATPHTPQIFSGQSVFDTRSLYPS